MKRLLNLFILSSMLLFGCTFRAGAIYDLPNNLNSCTSSMSVQAGHMVSGIDMIDVSKNFYFNGWNNDVCIPTLKNRNIYLPRDPNCQFTRSELNSQGVNGTLVLLLSRCGIPRSDRVTIDNIPFAQYQLNS